MFRLTAFTIALVFLCSNVYAADPVNLAGKPYAVQLASFDSLRGKLNQLDSATAMVQFSMLKDQAKKTTDKHLGLLIEWQRLKWLKDHRSGRSEVLEGLSSLLEKTKDHDALRADILVTLAEQYWDMQMYSRSLENYIYAYNIGTTLSIDEYPNKGELYYNLGGKFYYFRDFITAKKYFLEYWRSIPADRTYGVVSKRNTQALAHMNLEEYDSARFYFHIAEQEAIRTKDSFWIGLINGNKGYTYYSEGKYDECIPYFLKEISLIGGTVESASSMGNLARIYMMKGEKEKALEMQKRAYDILLKSGNINNMIFVRRLYSNFAKVLAGAGDYKGAYRFLDSALIASDISNKQRNMLAISGVQHKVEMEKHIGELQLKEKELAQQRMIRNWSLAAFAAMAVFFFIIFRQNRRISVEKKRSDDLLLNILPHETAEELKKTGAAKAKNYEMVTVLFTDFEDFTEASEHLSAEELVGEINYCYCEFDKILSRHGVEKIKTIGDSYMCAGGLPRESKTHAEDVVAVAIEIVKFMENEKAKRKSLGKNYFNMRLGIHTGPVVAGIVGIKKFAYDIWGDTVNIASRMESSGEPGKINISESTYERVKDRFVCTYRGEVNAKNKGKMKMYFVDPVIPQQAHEAVNAAVDLSI